MSRFYRTDPDDPDAPLPLSRYNCGHGVIEPGDQVEYIGPIPLPGAPHVVTELLAFGPETLAILNGGQYECSADNLRPLPKPEP